MLHTKFQASEPSGSEEEDLFSIFLCISMIEPRTPWRKTILNPGPFTLTNLEKDH